MRENASNCCLFNWHTHTHTNLIEIETKRETFETRSETLYIIEMEKGS